MPENKCVCNFKNGVWPCAMEWFNEKLTNQSHSFSDCIVEIRNIYIRLIISFLNVIMGNLSTFTAHCLMAIDDV